LLLVADMAARLLDAPQELPVGVMTAFVGAPFFIYLARWKGETMRKTGSRFVLVRCLYLSAWIGAHPAVLLGLVLVAFTAIVLNVGQGDYPIPLWDVWKTILGLPTANPDYPFVVNTLRLPAL
jgi:ABC-type Fe3+-siderophore transport system permease subunit